MKRKPASKKARRPRAGVLTLDLATSARERGTPIIDRQAARDIKTRYLRLRACGRNLNNDLFAKATKQDLHAAARRLNMLHRETLVFDDEEHMSVLADHVIYSPGETGKTMIEQAICDDVRRDADEKELLEVAARSSFRLLLTGDCVADLGIQAWDILSGEALLIADMGFSQTGQPGVVLATRILEFEDFAMTSGAPQLLYGVQPLQEIDRYIARTCGTPAGAQRLSGERAMWFEAFVLRICLKLRGRLQMRYQEESGA